MKIAQIAPLMESVPPRLYGGQRFSATRMAKDYVGIYRTLLATSAERERQEIELAPNAKDSNILRPLVA